MVEDTTHISKPRSKTARPKAVYLWTVVDVQKWLRRHCSDYYPTYCENFRHHDITGRSLIRLNDNTLMRMGVLNPDHRVAILREIMKIRLKTDIMEIRDLETRNNFVTYDGQTMQI